MEKRMSYEEIQDVIKQGYKPIGDLVKALKSDLIKGYGIVNIFVNEKYKIIDTVGNYMEIPYPCIIK